MGHLQSSTFIEKRVSGEMEKLHSRTLGMSRQIDHLVRLGRTAVL